MRLVCVAGVKTNSSCDIQSASGSASAFDMEDGPRRGSTTNATLLRIGEATALPVVLCGLLHSDRPPSCLYTSMMAGSSSGNCPSLVNSVNVFASDKSKYQSWKHSFSFDLAQLQPV